MTANQNEPQLFPEWKHLVKKISVMEYGTELTHGDLSNILGLPVGSTKYYSAITTANKELLSYGRYLENVRNQGYVLIRPEEFVAASNHQIKKSKRHATHALIIASNTPRDKLTAEQKKRSEEHYIGVSRLKSLLDRESKTLYEIEQQMVPRKLSTENPNRLNE